MGLNPAQIGACEPQDGPTKPGRLLEPALFQKQPKTALPRDASQVFLNSSRFRLPRVDGPDHSKQQPIAHQVMRQPGVHPKIKWKRQTLRALNRYDNDFSLHRFGNRSRQDSRMGKISHFPPGAAQVAAPGALLESGVGFGCPLACNQIFINQSCLQRTLRVGAGGEQLG